MKQISNHEYQEFLKYKKRRDSGQLVGTELLRLICRANNNNPEAIGKEILEIVWKYECMFADDTEVDEASKKLLDQNLESYKKLAE